MRKAAFIILHALDTDSTPPTRVAVAVRRGMQGNTPVYGAVGGEVNPGESFEQGALRETQEELNRILDLSKNTLVALPPYTDDVTRPSDPAEVQSFACEITPEQLRTLKTQAALLNPNDPGYDAAYASAFQRQTSGEVSGIEILPIEKAAALPFFYPKAGRDYEQTRELTEKSSVVNVHFNQVKELLQPNVKPDPESLWLLVKVPPITVDPNFKANPGSDEHGNPSGLIAIEDGQAIFRNPKDSLNGKHSTQKLPIDGTGVLIFPVKNDKKLGHAMGQLAQKLHDAPSLQALDDLLRDVHKSYLQAGAVPDMYNSDTGHFGRMDSKETIGNMDGVGLFAKKEKHLSLLVVKAEHPDTDIAFESSGAFIQGGKQYGKGLIVLVKDGDEIRKMAPDYAVENFVYLNGKHFTLESLPTVVVDAKGNLTKLTGNQSLTPKLHSITVGDSDMATITKEDLLAAVKDKDALILSSAGQKRDAFTTSDSIAYMRTGIGGAYEAIHTEIPEGARIIVGGIDSTKPTANLDAMLANGDIYPYWSKGKDVAERNTDFGNKTVKDNPQPAAATALREQAQVAGDDQARALSMKMFTVPLGDGNDISVYDPKIKESPAYDQAKETLATKFKINIDDIKGLGDPAAGAEAVKTMRADIGQSLEIGTRTDKPVKAFIPDAPLVIESAGTQWHAGPETAIVIRDNNISTLATSKIIDVQGGEKLKASDDYIVSGNRGGGKLAVNEIVPEARGMSESLEVGSPELKQQQRGG